MVLTFSGMLLMIVGLVNHTTMESGGIEQFMYPFWSFMAAMGGAILVTAGLSYLTYVRHPLDKATWLDDLTGLVLDRIRLSEPAPTEPTVNGNAMPPESVDAKAATSSEGQARSEWDLALRLLSGDERVMFKSLVDSNGEAYQKDLVIRTQMSDTKASRVIDRLEGKDLVVRERRGMSNMIRIIIPK
jgi:hypothetical protein